MIGTVIPQSILDWINKEIEDGEFTGVSEWVRVACREFYEKRKRDRAGGGALTNPFAQKIWPLSATFIY